MRELVIQGPLFHKRRNKKIILMLMDASLMLCAYLLAIIFRYYIEGTTLGSTILLIKDFNVQVLLSIFVLLSCQWLMKQYQSIWTVAGLEDFTLGTLSIMGGTVVNLVVSAFLPHRLPYLVTMLAGLLTMIFCNGMRLEWRILRRVINLNQVHLDGEPQRILIYGAGMAGTMVATEYKRNPQLQKRVVAFIDDDLEPKRQILVSIDSKK